MHLLGSRGQGFDVFKLLIAAVVAGAILLILLQTLQILPSIGSQDPNSTAANAVKSQINEPGSVQFLDNVTFNKGNSLNAKTIASQSKGLSEDQVCVMIGNDAPNKGPSGFNVPVGGTAGKLVLYNGSFAQKSRLMVLCDRQSEISGDLSTYGYSSNVDATGKCSLGGAATGASSTYCVVAVVAEQ